MPQRRSLYNALAWVPVAALALAFSGCAAHVAGGPSTAAPRVSSGASAPSDADVHALLDIQRMGVAVLADQWVNNDCSVELALSPDDVVCATVLDGADLTTAYEEVGGGLGTLTGDAGEAVHAAFDDSRDAGRAWIAAGCDDSFDDSCADEAETLATTLLALDSAFDEWAA